MTTTIAIRTTRLKLTIVWAQSSVALIESVRSSVVSDLKWRAEMNGQSSGSLHVFYAISRGVEKRRGVEGGGGPGVPWWLSNVVFTTCIACRHAAVLAARNSVDTRRRSPSSLPTRAAFWSPAFPHRHADQEVSLCCSRLHLKEIILYTRWVVLPVVADHLCFVKRR